LLSYIYVIEELCQAILTAKVPPIENGARAAAHRQFQEQDHESSGYYVFPANFVFPNAKEKKEKEKAFRVKNIL
jgi:hypothetical protein